MGVDTEERILMVVPFYLFIYLFINLKKKRGNNKYQTVITLALSPR